MGGLISIRNEADLEKFDEGNDATIISIEFPKLTRTSFDKVLKRFSKLNKIRFNAGTTYSTFEDEVSILALLSAESCYKIDYTINLNHSRSSAFSNFILNYDNLDQITLINPSKDYIKHYLLFFTLINHRTAKKVSLVLKESYKKKFETESEERSLAPIFYRALKRKSNLEWLNLKAWRMSTESLFLLLQNPIPLGNLMRLMIRIEPVSNVFKHRMFLTYLERSPGLNLFTDKVDLPAFSFQFFEYGRLGEWKFIKRED